MNTRARQRGLTLTGMAIVSALIIFAALTAMKLFPLYNESFKVSNAMKSIASQPGVEDKSVTELRQMLMRNFEVQDVETFTDATIQQYTRLERVKGTDQRRFTIEYEKRGPLFGQLDAVLKINESVALGSE